VTLPGTYDPATAAIRACKPQQHHAKIVAQGEGITISSPLIAYRMRYTTNFRISLWSNINQGNIRIVVFWVVIHVEVDVSVSDKHAVSNLRIEVTSGYAEDGGCQFL
jgi:hypothetical protein